MKKVPLFLKTYLVWFSSFDKSKKSIDFTEKRKMRKMELCMMAVDINENCVYYFPNHMNGFAI